MLSAFQKSMLCAVGAAMLLPFTGPSAAQSVKKPPETAAKKDPNVALKALDAGSKAYTAGKFGPAVEQLTAALANGGLPPPKMAQAYYYRGMAYKKQKKPAQALSDLTVAVWVKGGLSDSERAQAMDARNQVYREAGLGDQAPPVANGGTSPSTASATSPAAAPAAPTAAAAPVAPPPAQAAATEPAPPAPAAAPTPAPAPEPPTSIAAVPPPPTIPKTAPPAWQTESSGAGTASPPASATERPVWQAEGNSPPPPPPASPQPPQAAAAPIPAASSQPSANDAYQPPPAPTQTASISQPTPPPSSDDDTLSPLANAGKSISGFFNNMFGQSKSETPPTPATTSGTVATPGPGWVAADQAASPHGPTAQVSASEPQRAPGHEVAAAPPAPAPKAAPQDVAPAPAPAATPAPPPPAVKSAGGKYRLQLASVRSREEADRLVQTVMAQHAAQFGGAEAHVDETVIGDMGTFYRVRVGPYANATEPKKLCSALKPQGYDCQVVTQ
jgi:cell division septation protein DedD